MDIESKKRFPLREAYAFAAAHGFGDAAAEIQDMEIEWDRSYTSTVRRGRVIRALEKNRLLSQFIAEAWPFGSTSQGDAERRRCLRIADEYDVFLDGRVGGSDSGSEAGDTEALEFALETHLRDFLVRNLDHVEPGLRLYKEDTRTGVEFPVDGGRIDILAIDKSGQFVVIELKLSLGKNKALGQLLYYMGWVDRNLGNAPCRGVIVASDISEELVVAVSRAPGVTLARYKMTFAIERISLDTG